MSEHWYRDSIIYELDVRRFRDGNGDGWGDFRGLIDSLDYLCELGVNCLWLLPFYPSPFRDCGYDVQDYLSIDPRVGTFDDFTEFMDRACERGLKVVIDLVLNHTSEVHPWFLAARRGEKNRFHEYYVWMDEPPEGAADCENILPGEEDRVWTRDEVAGKFYYHRFYRFQPELNTANPEVLEELERVIDFWMAFGVAGFRIDAAAHLAPKAEDGVEEDPHPVLRELRSFSDDRDPPAVLLGEVDVPAGEMSTFFGDDDELHVVFNYSLCNFLALALARGDSRPIRDSLEKLGEPPNGGRWVNFLRNHDELNLAQLDEAEREDAFAAFAPREQMRIYGRGVRRRLASMLGGDRRRVEMALSLLFSLPGVPCVYYGDEIGMGDDLSRDGRDSVRTPMQWDAGPNAGFSSTEPAGPVGAVITEGEFSARKVNVADQSSDPGSMLNWFKGLTAARRACPELNHGAAVVLDAGDPVVFAHRRELDEGGAILAVHNLGSEPREIPLDIDPDGAERVLGGAELTAAGPRRAAVRLGGYGYGWFRVRG